MAFVVDLDMDKLVVGENRAVRIGPILGIVSCWDPRNRMYSMLLAMDSPLDELKGSWSYQHWVEPMSQPLISHYRDWGLCNLRSALEMW